MKWQETIMALCGSHPLPQRPLSASREQPPELLEVLCAHLSATPTVRWRCRMALSGGIGVHRV
jgi:hypothetical protein